MLYKRNEKWLASCMLILHLVSYLSGKCSSGEVISFLIGYVSKTFNRGLKGFCFCFCFFVLFFVFQVKEYN